MHVSPQPPQTCSLTLPPATGMPERRRTSQAEDDAFVWWALLHSVRLVSYHHRGGHYIPRPTICKGEKVWSSAKTSKNPHVMSRYLWVVKMFLFTQRDTNNTRIESMSPHFFLGLGKLPSKSHEKLAVGV